MKIKRSAMRKRVLDSITASEGAGWRGDAADSIVEDMEQNGMEFDPEGPEWPEVRPYAHGDHHWTLAPLRGGFLSYWNDADAERMSGAWNARRPGGEMERRFLDLVQALNDGDCPAPITVQGRIREALRLGVEAP